MECYATNFWGSGKIFLLLWPLLYKSAKLGLRSTNYLIGLNSWQSWTLFFELDQKFIYSAIQPFIHLYSFKKPSSTSELHLVRNKQTKNIYEHSMCIVCQLKWLEMTGTYCTYPDLVSTPPIGIHIFSNHWIQNSTKYHAILPGEYPLAKAEVWGLAEIDCLRALNLSSPSSWVQFNKNESLVMRLKYVLL